MAQPQRNLVIAHYRPDIVSGAEHSIADFAAQVDPRFHITMLVPGEGALAAFYRQRGIDVWALRVQGPRRILPGLHEVHSLLLARELKRRRVDAVLCNTFPAASRAATAARIAELPHAIYMRDYLADSPLFRRVLARADALFAISNDVIAHHSSMAPREKFRLTYNFINPEPVLAAGKAHASSGARALPFGPQHPVIGLVGRITPYKQPDLFVRAAPLVLREAPNARFALVGAAQEREKPYEESIRKLAADLGVQEQVAFLGQRKDAVALTAEFTVACLTSGREPLGRVILEAHLLGVPVVVPSTGGPAEIVLPEQTGLHFASTAPDAEAQLARQIVRLLKDPTLRECFIARGKEHVFATFANRRHVQIQEECIDELCEHTRARR